MSDGVKLNLYHLYGAILLKANDLDASVDISSVAKVVHPSTPWLLLVIYHYQMHHINQNPGLL